VCSALPGVLLVALCIRHRGTNACMQVIILGDVDGACLGIGSVLRFGQTFHFCNVVVFELSKLCLSGLLIGFLLGLQSRL
jgi:hypothetical protein